MPILLASLHNTRTASHLHLEALETQDHIVEVPLDCMSQVPSTRILQHKRVRAGKVTADVVPGAHRISARQAHMRLCTRRKEIQMETQRRKRKRSFRRQKRYDRGIGLLVECARETRIRPDRRRCPIQGNAVVGSKVVSLLLALAAPADMLADIDLYNCELHSFWSSLSLLKLCVKEDLDVDDLR